MTLPPQPPPSGEESAAAGDPSAVGAPPPPPGAYAQPYGQPFAPAANSAAALQLPPGVELASVGRRIGAYFLAIPLLVVTLGIGYVIWGAIIWSKGQTPALQVLGMRCWYPETRSVPGWGRMALREIIGRLAEAVLSIITALVSFILFLTRDDRRSLHDLVAGTVVVYDPQKVLER